MTLEVGPLAIGDPLKEQPHFQLATHSPSELALFRVEQERLVVQLASSEEAVSFSEITRINLQHTLGAYVAIVHRRSGRPLMIRSRCVIRSRESPGWQ